MLCGMPVDRRVYGDGALALITGQTAADASLGRPGQEGVQVGSGRGGAAGVWTGVPVACQQAEGLDVVPGASAASASGTALMAATRGSP
jgi:hypothetical protein